VSRSRGCANGTGESGQQRGGINFIKRYPRAIEQGPGSPRLFLEVINAAFIREML